MSKLKNLQLSYQLEHLKNIPPPDECLILDDYATLETKEELRSQVSHLLEEIEEMLLDQASTIISDPLHDAFYMKHVRVYKEISNCVEAVGSMNTTTHQKD